MRYRVRAPYAKGVFFFLRILSRSGHGKPGLKQGGPPSKAKYGSMTDSEEYREGKVKRTPVRGVK